MDVEEFERLLDAAHRGQPAATKKEEPKTMPELGGNRFAGAFGSMMQDVRKQVDEAIRTSTAKVAAAHQRLVKSIETGGTDAARAIHQEADAVERSFAEMLGNAPPETEQEKPEGKEGGG